MPDVEERLRGCGEPTRPGPEGAEAFGGVQRTSVESMRLLSSHLWEAASCSRFKSFIVSYKRHISELILYMYQYGCKLVTNTSGIKLYMCTDLVSIMCRPFQYLMMPRNCRVLTMSFAWMHVSALKSTLHRKRHSAGRGQLSTTVVYYACISVHWWFSEPIHTFYGDGAAVVVREVLEDDVLPIGAVAEQSEITQRPLRRPDAALDAAQRVAYESARIDSSRISHRRTMLREV